MSYSEAEWAKHNSEADERQKDIKEKYIIKWVIIHISTSYLYIYVLIYHRTMGIGNPSEEKEAELKAKLNKINDEVLEVTKCNLCKYHL